MSYGLSVVAVGVALKTGYETMTNSEVLPAWVGPVLAISVVSSSFAYAYFTKRKRIVVEEKQMNQETESAY